MSDNNSELEELRIDRQLRAGGVHISPAPQGGHDKRVTRAIDYVLASIGGALLLLMWRAGDVLVDLKVGVATLTARMDAKDERDDFQDKRLDTLEGKTFRGVAGYEKEEPHRGN